jgi:integrase
MVDTDDVQGYERKFENQKKLLEQRDIDEADRTAIRQFIAHLRANTDDNKGTIADHCNQLRLASERARLPLVEMTMPEVNVFLTDTLEDEYDLSEGTIRNYTKSVKMFFKWSDDHDFGAEIVIGAPNEREKDPEEALTDDEVEALLDAAPNARDRAMIALLDDTGLRIGAILSFQMRHVDFEGNRATLTINEDANVKGDSGLKPITWSREYVANWLAEHPRPDDPDAALIHKRDRWDASEDGALRQQYAGQRIAITAEAAGLDVDRIEARLFRDSAITRWILDDMGEQAIKQRVGWDPDSDMIGTYSRAKDDQIADLVFDHYGIDPDEADEDDGQRGGIEECPGCKATLRGHETFCPSCGHGLTNAAVDAVDAEQAEQFDTAVESDDPAKRAAARDLAAALDIDVELAERVVDARAD